MYPAGIPRRPLEKLWNVAKSGKASFRDSIAQYNTISSQIAGRRFAPVYLLMGEEPYYIDRLAEQLAGGILTESDRAFGQIVVYGKDTEAGAVINLCRQMPMSGPFQVVIVKEAQQLRKLEQLSLYTASPSPTTILVLCHKEKNLDKRSALYKHIADKGVVYEAVAPRDYEIGPWISDHLREQGYSADAKSVAMLADHLGADIGKITNELGKLFTYLPRETKNITAEHIEQNIGISKDFNIFELTRAMSEKNMAKAMLIADHFARNPKEYPFVMTVGSIFTHFQRIFIVNYQRWHSKRKGMPMPSEMDLARSLKLPNAFFLKEYLAAASLYPNSKVFAILGLIREYDMKSKGMNTGQADDGELLKELLLKIFAL